MNDDSEDGVSGQEWVAPKRQPKRRDSRQTQQLILDAAAELLAEVGFERLSTNQICTRAGMTPPALYRYFPNKYAVLFELAHGLLIEEDRALQAWIEFGGLDWTTEKDGLASVDRLQMALLRVAEGQVGALWIMRAMRAFPALQEVRVVAHTFMHRRLAEAVLKAYPAATVESLATPARLLVEMLQLGLELALDQPPLDTTQLRHGVSVAFVANLIEVRSQRGE